MVDIGLLAQLYGYPVVLLGTALQGEAVLLICGFLAHQGYLNVWIVWLIAALGATAGDVIYFYLGYRYGDRVLARLPHRASKSIHWARDTVSAHPVKVLLLMRYFFGMRIVLPIVVGMSSIPFGRFIRYNLPTAMFWAGMFVGAGYLFGLAAKSFVKEVEQVEIFLTIGLAVLAIGYQWLGKRISERKAEKDDAEHKG
jgi:membrane protein DedA with SNARE-associated domain